MFLDISYFRQPSLLWKYILYFTEIVKWNCQAWEYEPLFGKKVPFVYGGQVNKVSFLGGILWGYYMVLILL